MSRKELGYHFYVVDNQMIVHFDSDVFGKFYHLIDFPSFEVIKSNGSTFHYFKDKNYVYLESYMNRFTPLANANPANFHILDFEKGMANSGNNDYVFDQLLPHRLDAYEPISAYYQKLGNRIYCAYTHELIAVDAASFEVLYPDQVQNVAKDKNHVYFRNEVVGGADAESFAFLEACFNSGYYREQDHIYYAKDKNTAYYVDTIAKAFKVIRSKDIADFGFKVVDELGYAFDGKYTYLFGKRV